MRKRALAVDWYSLLSYARAVPMTLDEAQRKHGMNVANVMRRDAAVAGALRKWKQEILSEELRIMPPPGFEDNQACLDECQFLGRCFDRLDVRPEDLAWQMLDCAAEGHVLVEQTWARGDGADRNLNVWDSLRPIPNNLYVIVQDAYGKFLGVIGWVPGHVPLLWQGPILLPLENIPGFIPAWKFALITHDPVIGGLMGRTRVEPAYNPYAIKYKNWALLLQYLTRFAGPIPIGEVSPDAVARDPLKTPEEEMGEFLAMIEEMGGVGVPFGTNIQFLKADGGEKVFVNAIDACNREIATAILGSPKTVMEAKNDSQAAQGSAQDAVDEDTGFSGAMLCSVINRQLIRPLVRSNRGPDFPVPVMVLGADSDDFAEASVGAAALYTAGAVADNQEPAIAKKLGLPAPDKPISERQALNNPQPVTVGKDGKPVPAAKPGDTPKPKDKPKTSFWNIGWQSRR
jgi:phage gp29-like protein